MKHKYTVAELERLLYEAQEEEQLERLRHIKNYNEAVKETPNSVESWNMYPPKAVADTMGIMHPQEITESDWAWIWFWFSNGSIFIMTEAQVYIAISMGIIILMGSII